jgi:hypothetical protein
MRNNRNTEKIINPQLARVIPFRVKSQALSISSAKPLTANLAKISQERLQKGKELLEQEWAAIRAARQFLMELENDLSAGAEVETGALVFDEVLKMVRPSHTSGNKAAVSGI